MMATQYFNLGVSIIIGVGMLLYFRGAKKVYSSGKSMLPLFVWVVCTIIFYAFLLANHYYELTNSISINRFSSILRTQGLVSILVMVVYKIMRLRAVKKNIK